MPLKHLNARLSLPVLGEHILPVFDGLYVVRVCGVRSNSMLRKRYLNSAHIRLAKLKLCCFPIGSFTRVRTHQSFYRLTWISKN
jgi:hypothetical protein